MQLILKEENRFYISEGLATYDIHKATIYKSFEELLIKVPLYKDWNIGYEVFQIVDNQIVKVKENEYYHIFLDLREKGKLEHFNGIKNAFIRTTIQ